MKVQGSAFLFAHEVDAPDASFSQFFDWLKTATVNAHWPPHHEVTDDTSHRREFFLNELPDVWCGAVISARRTQFNHFVRRVGNTVTIEARDNQGDPPVEVNFFCLRKDSNKGIYSHYYGSYAFNSFLWELWSSYRYFVEARREAALDLLGDPDNRDIRALYSINGKANTAPIFSPKAFEAMMRELVAVSELHLTTYSVDAREDQPVANRIRNVHHVFRLQEQHQRIDQRLMGWIREKRESAKRVLANGRTSLSGSVIGLDASGQEKTIMFGHNLENQLDFDYDDIGTFNVDQLHANPCLVQMLAKLRTGVMFR